MSVMRWDFTAAGAGSVYQKPAGSTQWNHAFHVQSDSGNCDCVIVLEGSNDQNLVSWLPVATFTATSAASPQDSGDVAQHGFLQYRATCNSINGTGARASLILSS